VIGQTSNRIWAFKLRWSVGGAGLYSFNLDRYPYYMNARTAFIAQGWALRSDNRPQITICLSRLLTSKGASALRRRAFITRSEVASSIRVWLPGGRSFWVSTKFMERIAAPGPNTFAQWRRVRGV